MKEESSIDETNTEADDFDESKMSSLRSYLSQMGEKQRESFSKMLETAVDASCLPSCENGLENQLDVLMVRGSYVLCALCATHTD